MMMSESSERAPICFYGDDFTGATAHLAGYHENGIRGLLFLRVPSLDVAREYAKSYDVMGVAGISRSLAPTAMIDEAKPAFELFSEINASDVHYKICSTFDSAPRLGNIGTIIELARGLYGDAPVPLVAGCPDFGRYTVFGNHFARDGAQIARLDRHRTMANHPATPMHEADLRCHLASQTDLACGLVDVLALDRDDAALAEAWKTASAQPIVLFDTLENTHLDRIAALLDSRARTARPRFAVAAQGLAYACGRHLTSQRGNMRGAVPTQETTLADVDRALVLSGSAAPLNGRQLRRALQSGWLGLPIDAVQLFAADGIEASAAALAVPMLDALAAGRSVAIYTAGASESGEPPTSDIEGFSAEEFSNRVGQVFARIAQRAVTEAGIRRIVVAGGDTSSHAMRNLDADALEIAGVSRHGGRLCRLLAAGRVFDGVEVMLKGGQVGHEDTFVTAWRGDAWRVA